MSSTSFASLVLVVGLLAGCSDLPEGVIASREDALRDAAAKLPPRPVELPNELTPVADARPQYLTALVDEPPRYEQNREVPQPFEADFKRPSVEDFDGNDGDGFDDFPQDVRLKPTRMPREREAEPVSGRPDTFRNTPPRWEMPEDTMKALFGEAVATQSAELLEKVEVEIEERLDGRLAELEEGVEERIERLEDEMSEAVEELAVEFEERFEELAGQLEEATHEEADHRDVEGEIEEEVERRVALRIAEIEREHLTRRLEEAQERVGQLQSEVEKLRKANAELENMLRAAMQRAESLSVDRMREQAERAERAAQAERAARERAQQTERAAPDDRSRRRTPAEEADALEADQRAVEAEEVEAAESLLR